MAWSTTTLVRSKATLAAIILMMPVASMACLGASLSAEASSEKCLRIGFLDEINSLNPNVATTDSAKIFSGLVYDCLQGVGNELEATPNLALQWEIADGFEPYGSVWEYEITPNARWHDDTKLTADDVVFTVNHRALNYTQLGYPYSSTYFINYAEKVDEYTVRIHFYDRTTEEPIPVAFAGSLYFPILPKHLLQNLSSADIGFNWEGSFNYTTPPLVGSGPFMATENICGEWSQGDKITLVRNPSYHWKADRGLEIQFDKLELHFFKNSTSLKNSLENGSIDVAQLPRDDYLEVEERIHDGFLTDLAAHTDSSPSQSSIYISITMNSLGPNPSRLDPVIRQAMAMATDKSYIVDNYYLGLAEEGTTLIPQVNKEWHYELTDDELYHYDLDAATALLEAGGYRYTPDSPTVRVCTADSYAVTEGLVGEGTLLEYVTAVRQEYPEEKDVAIYLQSEWAKVGIEIEYTIMTEAAYPWFPLYWSGYYSFDTLIWCSLGPYSDPDPNSLLCTQSIHEYNINYYHSSEYDNSYNESITTLDADQRKEYVHDCQKVHYEDVSYIMLAEIHQTYVWRTDNFTGWGDWSAHPGRSIDAYWGGNTLYFDLSPAGEDTTLITIVVLTVGVVAAVAVAIVYFRKKVRT